MAQVDRSLDEDGPAPVDNLIVSLRAYATRADLKPGVRKGFKPRRDPPGDWVLIFDCETRTTPDQRLRFGAYQIRDKGRLFELGFFYEPNVLTDPNDLRVLEEVRAELEADSDGPRVRLLTGDRFVEDVFFGSGRDVGAQIVGFNLPFDLSRLAIDHDSARGAMRGGFTLKLSEKASRPRVVVKHLSQSAAMIRFAGTRRSDRKDEPENEDDEGDPEESAGPDRGYFVDVKTLSAALLGPPHNRSLEGLSKLLDVRTKKTPSEEHGGPLTPEYVRYGMKDVQTTWECFDALGKRFHALGLRDTGLYELYSEASLGKAYLKTMNITRWSDLQPTFPPQIIGRILSAYYGGRAEVHIRRQIVPVIHCDFLSMYPTVCTLMGLWKFIRAEGVSYREDAASIRSLLDSPQDELIERFRHKPAWSDLAAVVRIAPNDNLFPVRAYYPGADSANIGLNYLTSEEPFWFTLADVLVSKILTGRTPHVVSAMIFEPLDRQEGLRSIDVHGHTIDPAKDDFYRRLIIHRNSLKAEAGTSKGARKAQLDSDEQAVKILANATSYGIFVELNVEDYATAKPMVGFSASETPFKFKSKKFEKPGSYFHPLLGALITGAARLMLALAERQVLGQGLDWAFCDTDSMAIANVDKLPLEEFKMRALRVHEWFKDLNPYGEKRSILQLEKVNFPPNKRDDLKDLDPPYCLAISAKRYVLFNKINGKTVIRKASGHGLGHLLAPYDEEPAERAERIKTIGVPLWQEDLWKEIIRATESKNPDQVRYIEMNGYAAPAASPYAATTPELLRWFKTYNERQRPGEWVFPFGFLLSLQPKSRIEMAKDEPGGLKSELWRRREPRPAAPYFKRADDAKDHAFDRDRGDPIPPSWLKSHGRSLVRYHLHPESKFWSSDDDQRGVLQRRHVHVLVRRSIGKESDNLEENEFIGEDAGPIEHPMEASNVAKVARFVFEMQERYDISDRMLLDRAKVSPHTLKSLRDGGAVGDDVLQKLATAVEEFRLEAAEAALNEAYWVGVLRALAKKIGGRNKLAALLGVSGPYLGRVLRGVKPITGELIERLKILRGELSLAVK
jgi:hypothetical protein